MKFRLETPVCFGYNVIVFRSHAGPTPQALMRGNDLPMSASQKKKLRNEQNAAQLTEKQIAEQKEAKKLRTYTAIFSIAIVLMLCVVVATTVMESGFLQRRTTAVTVGDYEISAPELNHYYVDSVHQFQQQTGQAMLFSGLAPNTPLDEQIIDDETGKTWADRFLEIALENIHHTYALYDAAVTSGMTLEEEDQAAVDSMLQNIEMDAKLNAGFPDLKSYVKTVYGTGANLDTYRHYIEVQYLASKYSSAHMNELEYTDEQLREKDAENPIPFNSYSYNDFYLSNSFFLEGGTTGEDGAITYSDEEKAAAAAKCEEVAKALTAEPTTTAVVLDKAIADLGLEKADEPAKKTNVNTGVFDTQLPAAIKDWILSADRKAGDVTMIPNEIVTNDEDGNEKRTVNGYYIVLFNSVDDNNFPISNVRHILVQFDGGSKDENGQMVYTDAEKAVARGEAEGILAEFLAGDATEESFAKLAIEKSEDPGSASNGGLIQNILPTSNYVDNFLNWSIDRSRQAGDTGIVETEYGCHVMYYVGDSERNYRDTMIQNVLTGDAMVEWEDSLVEAIPAETLQTKYAPTDLVLQMAQ